MRVARTCHLCEAMCGLMVTIDGTRVTDIRGDADDVLSRGHICPKAFALREVHDDPDRLRHPVRRTRSGWKQVTWDEALGVPLFGALLGTKNRFDANSQDANPKLFASLRMFG